MAHYSRIKDYSETHNGLLKRRGELFNEAERITERLAEIKNDIKAMDKTLRVIGYEGELDMIMPKYQRSFRFDQGDLAKAVVFELRYAAKPLKAREIAENMLVTKGMDIRDTITVTALRSRVSKSLRRLRDRGVIVGMKDGQRGLSWVLRPRARIER